MTTDTVARIRAQLRRHGARAVEIGYHEHTLRVAATDILLTDVLRIVAEYAPVARVTYGSSSRRGGVLVILVLAQLAGP